MRSHAITIYAHTRAHGACRSCGAAIEWAELTTGRRMPFDRIVPLYEQSPLFIGGRVVLELDSESSPSHFQTCPDAKAWRRRA
jgi:hypothetical protein